MDFTPEEVAYLRTQRLARIATASASGVPDVAPVGFRFDGTRFLIGGRDLPRTIKYHNIRRTGQAALVIDDLASVDPWRPRGIKVRGRAELVARDGREVIAVYPERKWSWGVNRAGDGNQQGPA